MGVDEALDQAEQKQPGRKPPQLRKQKRYRACELEKIMDMVQHHEHQRDPFQLRSGKATAQPRFLHCVFQTDTLLFLLLERVYPPFLRNL